MASNLIRNEEEQEALFHAYPCADYYVQTPSSASHANGTDGRHHLSAPYLSPFPLEESFNATSANVDACHDASRFTLSRYSSSRGSNNSFLHAKKLSCDLHSHCNVTDHSLPNHPVSGLFVEARDPQSSLYNDADDNDYLGKYSPGLLSFGYSSSGFCVAFQILWRLLLSFGLSLLVFFLVTRPPRPIISVKMAGIRRFELGEGIDNSGVVTKILNSNCSLHLEIENRSKLFGLHIHPPTLDMAFGRLNIGSSQGERLYVESYTDMVAPIYVGTKKKAMYGAGRAMLELLESGKGLPLVIHVDLTSHIRVVWNLIQPTYRHRAHCHVLVNGTYDQHHHSHVFNSTCTITAST